MIEVRNLHYTYPGELSQALDGVSLSVGDGEFVLLAGPSGAGKSTLLRCLNGLIPHFSGGTISGEVEVGGKDALSSGPQVMSGLVGFVFQDPEAQNVVDEVESEIAFGLENTAVPEALMRERVQEALAIMGLTSLRRRSPWTLSGGERQKLAIASVLAARPRVLVLDEPTSQLDPSAARNLLETVDMLNHELGLTVVLVEHRLERVVRYAQRLIYLEDGKVTIDGPMRQALAEVDVSQLPPLARLAERMAWTDMPLSISEGRVLATSQISYRHNGNKHKLRAEGASGSSLRSVIEAIHVSYRFNGSLVLDDVSIALGAGEAVALLGSNGAGKSTLLKCLVGLLRPQSGQVKLFGHNTAGMTVADICRDVAYLPQVPDDLLFADTVQDELLVTLSNHGISGPEAAGQTRELLTELELASLSESYPRDLSVGQRQRVALGAVSIVGPRILLLDEPTRGLDYAAKVELVTLWKRWLAKGMGLLLVTHDVELAARVAQRVLVIDSGRIIADGPMEEIMSTMEQFEPQMARLFPGKRWLTVDEVMNGVKNAENY